MPSAVVTLDVGRCGCTLGYEFWKQIAQEHGLDCLGHFCGSSDEQVKRIDVYFSESRTGRYVPRNIMVDMDPSTLNYIRKYDMGQIFEPNTLVCGEATADNNFAKGYTQPGETILDETKEVMRRQVEGCNSHQGVQMCHSIGGGCGSGFGSLLLEHIRADYEKELILSFTVFPDPTVSDVVVEPYNAVLSTKRLIEDVNQVICIDNAALSYVCKQTMKINHPQYSDLNYLISLVMNGMTSSVRYSGQLNSTFRKIGLNMTPYERLHFFAPGFAPLCSKGDRDYQAFTVNNLVLQMFHTETLMCSIDPTKGKYFAATSIFRGDMSMKDIEVETTRLQDANSNNFMTWMPTNIFNSCVDVSHIGFYRSVTFLGNTTSIASIFEKMDKLFQVMFEKNAYIHWYKKFGIDDQNLFECEQNMDDLVQSYNKYTNLGVEDDPDADADADAKPDADADAKPDADADAK